MKVNERVRTIQGAKAWVMFRLGDEWIPLGNSYFEYKSAVKYAEEVRLALQSDIDEATDAMFDRLTQKIDGKIQGVRNGPPLFTQSDIDAAVDERTEWCAKLIEDIRLAGGTGIEPGAAGDLPVALVRNSLLKCLVFAIRQGPSPLGQDDHPEHVGEVVPGEEEQPDGLPASVSSTENERSVE